MALYKTGTNVKPGTGTAFDTTHVPGVKVPLSGIYRCDNCGAENCCNKGDPLPPQNHHQHPTATAVKWRLLVAAQ